MRLLYYIYSVCFLEEFNFYPVWLEFHAYMAFPIMFKSTYKGEHLADCQVYEKEYQVHSFM